MRYPVNTAPVNGNATYPRTGQIGMELNADGSVVTAKHSDGVISGEIIVEGGLTKAILMPSGEMTLGLSLAGAVKRAVHAAGAFLLSLAAGHWIPYKPIPAGLVRNMNDREMIIPEDRRVFEVQADNALRVKNAGALRVRGERRL